MDVLEIVNKLGLTAGLLLLVWSVAAWAKPHAERLMHAHFELIENIKQTNQELAGKFRKWPSDPFKVCRSDTPDQRAERNEQVKAIVLQMRQDKVI